MADDRGKRVMEHSLDYEGRAKDRRVFASARAREDLRRQRQRQATMDETPVPPGVLTPTPVQWHGYQPTPVPFGVGFDATSSVGDSASWAEHHSHSPATTNEEERRNEAFIQQLDDDIEPDIAAPEPAPRGRGRRRRPNPSRAGTSSGISGPDDWRLREPQEGGPQIIDLLTGYLGHIACALWTGHMVIFTISNFYLIRIIFVIT